MIFCTLENRQKGVKLIGFCTGSVVGVIKKFAGEIPGYDWKIKSGTLPISHNGETSSMTGGALTIIDVGKFVNGTDLALARTIMHEAVHAYLVSYFRNNAAQANQDYATMVQEYSAMRRPNLNTAQHDEITRSFKDDIAAALTEFGDARNYTFSKATTKSECYSDMAWGGLEQTRAYKALPQSTKDRIRDTIIAEQYGVDSDG